MSKTKYQARPGKSLAVRPQPAAAIAPVSQDESVLKAILEASRDPNANPEIMKQMFDLHVSLLNQKREIEFNKAIALVEQELPTIVKNKTAHIAGKNGGNGYEYNYSDYANIDERIRPILRRHKMALSFDTKFEVGFEVYEGTLTHELGHKRVAHIRLPIDKSGGKNDLQAVGSTKSYARRYLVMDLLNLVTGEDNDASNPNAKISEAQADWVEEAIDAEKIDQSKFMALVRERWGVETIDEIPVGGLPEVEQWVNTRQRTNKNPITKAPR